MVSLFKLALFLSAYSPLFTLIALQSVSSLSFSTIFQVLTSSSLEIFSLLIGYWWIILCFFPMIFAYLFGKHVYNKSQQITGIEYFYITAVEDKTGEILSYVVPYIISLMAFNILDLNGFLSILILLIMLYPIYSNSALIYINPILSLFGYRLYKVGIFHSSSLEKPTTIDIMLISKSKNIIINKTIPCSELSDKIYLEVSNGNK